MLRSIVDLLVTLRYLTAKDTCTSGSSTGTTVRSAKLAFLKEPA